MLGNNLVTYHDAQRGLVLRNNNLSCFSGSSLPSSNKIRGTLLSPAKGLASTAAMPAFIASGLALQ